MDGIAKRSALGNGMIHVLRNPNAALSARDLAKLMGYVYATSVDNLVYRGKLMKPSYTSGVHGKNKWRVRDINTCYFWK